MKKTIKLITVFLLVSVLIVSCGKKDSESLPTPFVEKTQVPSIDSEIGSYLSAWEAKNYEEMYSFLSSQSQAVISQDVYSKLLSDLSSNMTLVEIQTDYMYSTVNPSSATGNFSVSYQTALFGTFDRQIQANWVLENNEWKIIWDNGSFLPELAGGNTLAAEIRTQERGDIFDNQEQPIVEETTAYALGITPGEIEDGKEGQLVFLMSELTGKTRESIYESYEDAGPSWYVPVGEVSGDEIDSVFNQLLNLGGAVISEFTSRYYYNGGIAPQSVGYVLGISEEQLEVYKDQGYLGDEQVGQAGLEKYTERELAGRPSASLYVVNPEGQVVSKVSQADPQPPSSIYTTLNRNLQIEAQKAIASFKGAIIAMEVDTGRILAIASSPGFDPNLFTPSNPNSFEQLDAVLNDGNQRLLNRASQSAYPPGSVFKIVTMAAALESDLYAPDTVYYCDHYFTELPGFTGEDWTLEKELPPSGDLTLVQGLMRSCNPWFYHLGLQLFRKMGANYIADIAKGFGLGEATGIDQVAEATGSIPVPANDGDAVQQGIGQGQMLVTPLQVVRFIAALANGGTLYRPQMIERIITSTGVNTFNFAPEEQGTLPISQETYDAIIEGMRLVVRANLGTAHDELEGLNIPMSGKTGTAQNPIGDSHAWFSGFTETDREDKPDIAIVVLAENAGEGSDIAAPIFRRMVEVYYFGEPLKLYPWESRFNVTRTPTLEFTLTPTDSPDSGPEPTATPSG